MKKIQLTDIHKEKLFQIPLFRDLPLNIKESLLEKLDFIVYAADKKEIVVTQGTPCNKLYVLLEGKLRTDIIDGLGNEVMIEYLFEHKKKDSLIVEITHTQSQLAEYLNVSRPALSKEINKIIKEGLITMEGKRVEILNKAALEKFI